MAPPVGAWTHGTHERELSRSFHIYYRKEWGDLAHILVVDDDPHIRELVSHLLKNEGYTIAEAANGNEALEAMESFKADLVILDIMMPGMDGWELCRELDAAYDIPLLMLTAKGETSQKVKGFELGTDDYLVKPFDPLELTVRVKALLKRYKISASQEIQFGDVRLNRKTYECYAGSAALTLPLKEFELLFLLGSYPGKTFSRDQIIEHIWGYDYEGDERTVDVHIKRLRERFADQQDRFQIRTIRGLGYRLEVLS
ncbi:DNA-binding response regulator [Paenibacillus cineris]|nr:DNA-binding response regulator [Paenibacillus cineris]